MRNDLGQIALGITKRWLVQSIAGRHIKRTYSWFMTDPDRFKRFHVC